MLFRLNHITPIWLMFKISSDLWVWRYISLNKIHKCTDQLTCECDFRDFLTTENPHVLCSKLVKSWVILVICFKNKSHYLTVTQFLPAVCQQDCWCSLLTRALTDPVTCCLDELMFALGEAFFIGYPSWPNPHLIPGLWTCTKKHSSLSSRLACLNFV